MKKKDTTINRDYISKDYLLGIANKDGAYGYVSVHDIINAPCYKMQGPCEDCQYREWLKGEIEPKTDVLGKIKAEIHASAVFKPDYEWYVNEKRIMQIIDRYSREV